MGIMSQNSDPARLTRQWLEQVVIGLGLCPFAAQPTNEDRVRIHVSTAQSDAELLESLQAELILLDQQAASSLETTLLVVPHMLADFADYNQFLDKVDLLLEHFHWTEKYQIASFHPQYRFAGTTEHAAENLTNRSPYPVLHIIREASLTSALQDFAAADEIPARNIKRMESLDEAEKRQLFPWLFD